MKSKFVVWLLMFCISCNTISSEKTGSTLQANSTKTDKIFQSKISDIPLPQGFFRKPHDDNSFAAWLENVTLKKDKTVFQYNGIPKANQSVQYAVLNISVGKKDLQQCADAVMRLRAEYLYSFGRYNEIIFRDYNNNEYKFTKPYSKENFDRYLENIFGRCGSASLQKQLRSHIAIQYIEPGDVLIHGGFPGHAVIVMDLAENKFGQKIYLIAQSYMPAQDIHLLINPMDKNISPWYNANDETIINTPEYTFNKYELKRW